MHRRVMSGLAAAVALGAAACGTTVGGDDSVALDYWLWDAIQLPAYQNCVDAFEDENPDIDVRISQYGFDDYWRKLTASFVAGAGPDVFTDHLTRYPEYVQRDLLLDLGSLSATEDFDGSEYQEGLAKLWAGEDGKQYGIPKDFDTIALFYDRATIEEAGLTPAELENLDWNPEDGGTFEDVIARLTVDANGVRGDEEGFDPDNVATYGLASNGSGGATGQTTWSWLAGSTGWRFTDADVWGQEYNFDDPGLHKTLEWYFGLVDKGFMAPYEEVGTEPTPAQSLGSGRAALAPHGSWMLNVFGDLEGVDLGISPLPSGPEGRISLYNGLADSVSAQTDHPEEAGRLAAFLGSEKCHAIVGEAGVVLPARPSGTEAATQAFADRGIDVAPFTDLVDQGNTLYFPVTEQFGSIESLMTPILDEIYIGEREPATLIEINERVNSMLE